MRLKGQKEARDKEKKKKSSLNPTNLYDIKTKNPVGFRFNHQPIPDFNSPFLEQVLNRKDSNIVTEEIGGRKEKGTLPAPCQVEQQLLDR